MTFFGRPSIIKKTKQIFLFQKFDEKIEIQTVLGSKASLIGELMLSFLSTATG